MGRPTKYRINLTIFEQAELERLTRQQTAPQHRVKRAKIILMANGDGASNQAIAQELGIYKAEVTNWTKRWIERAMEPIEERLADLQRCGRPDEITPEQWCRIIALACEKPEHYGRPVSHWSSPELADEAVKQRIVDRLSPGHLRKVLKKNTATSPQSLLVKRQGG